MFNADDYLMLLSFRLRGVFGYQGIVDKDEGGADEKSTDNVGEPMYAG